MSRWINRHLVIDALSMALGQRRPSALLIHHSDRGSQYTSDDFRDKLDQHDIQCSMSARGNCYDNAVVESFFGLLKRERVNRVRYRTRGEARADVFDYIECFYNRNAAMAIWVTSARRLSKSRHAVFTKLSIKPGQNHPRRKGPYGCGIDPLEMMPILGLRKLVVQAVKKMRRYHYTVARKHRYPYPPTICEKGLPLGRMGSTAPRCTDLLVRARRHRTVLGRYPSCRCADNLGPARGVYQRRTAPAPRAQG